MASTEKLVLERYSDPAKEEHRNRVRRSGSSDAMSGFNEEARNTIKVIDPYITAEKDVIEFGCATGFYAEFWASKCKSYVGVDIVPAHVDYFNGKQLPNAQALLGDATDCPEFSDERFDVVLCFGPMYHLPPEERGTAMLEMKRICKPGGLMAFAYIPTAGVILHAIANQWGRKQLPLWRRLRDKHAGYYPNHKGNETFETGTDDVKPGTFYFTMPEEMDALAARCGLPNARHIGVEIVLNKRQIAGMDAEQLAAWYTCSENLLKYPSLAGAANHALMMCRKRG